MQFRSGPNQIDLRWDASLSSKSSRIYKTHLFNQSS